MSNNSAHPPATGPLSPADVRAVMIGIMLAMLLGAIDQTIVSTALPTIGKTLGDVEHMPWVVTSYLLAATAVTPLYGKFSDIHGRRIALLIGIATFVIGSVACAVAPTMWVLIVARAVQGLGGGGLISLAQTIIADITTPKERARYQVYIASVFIASSLLGPVLGGFFAQKLHWSMIFWINVPLGIGAFWIANAALKRLPRHERRHRLDIVGALLMALATVTLMLALTWGGVRYPWGSPEVLGLVAASALLWVGFAARLLRADEPLIPLAVLSNGVVGTGTLTACFSMGTFIGLSIYMPVYFEVGLGYRASTSGLLLIPLMLGTVIGATLSGRTMAYVRHYKRLPIAGLSVSVIATALLALYCDRMPLVLFEVMLFAVSFSMGTVLPVTTVCIQNAVRTHELGTATATMNFFRQLGGAIIVAVFGAIVLSGITSPKLSATGEGIDPTALAPADLLAMFPWVLWAAAAGFALALLFLLMMEERPLRANARHAAEAAFAD